MSQLKYILILKLFLWKSDLPRSNVSTSLLNIGNDLSSSMCLAPFSVGIDFFNKFRYIFNLNLCLSLSSL